MKSFRQYTKYLLFFFVFALVQTQTAKAQDSTDKQPFVSAELISEVTSIKPGESFEAAVRLEMAPGWHTYWQNPGTSGMATTLQWQLPEGFTVDEILWPYPEWIAPEGLPDLATFAYEHTAYLLTRITPPENLETGTVVLKARVDWLACLDICLPGGADISLSLPVQQTAPVITAQQREVFSEARQSLPFASQDWRVTAESSEKEIRLRIHFENGEAPLLEKLTFFPAREGLLDYNISQKLEKVAGDYLLILTKHPDAVAPIQEMQGVLVGTIAWDGTGGHHALQIDTSIKTTPTETTAAPLKIPFQVSTGETLKQPIWLMFVFAFLGGIILNLMPCVLPVLSIKLLGFISHAGEDRAKILRHGLIFTAGVLVSFWILAGILIILRAGGRNLGWGFQLQEPGFIVVMSAVMFLFGLSLFGVFETGASLVGLGSKTGKSGPLGTFTSGILTTIIATPCTGPLMAPALGWGLTQPAAISMLIFTILGLGLATPYLVISSIPRLLKYLPKPGAWMETFKQAMGFPMMAAVVFFLWVLGRQAGSDAVASLVMCLLVIGFGSWILGRWALPVKSAKTRNIARMVSLLLIIGSVVYTASGIKAQSIDFQEHRVETNDGWEPFSFERLAELRATGQPVFIDFTADWCLQCQTNKKTTLHNDTVRQKFQALDVVLMEADWTNRDPEITKALEAFGRSGVPLYVLYGPGLDTPPVILPQVLFPKTILEYLSF